METMQSNAHSAERHDRRDRLALRWGLAASVALHVLLFFLFSSDRLPPSPFSAAGPRAGDDIAAAGGGAMHSVQLSIVEPVTIPRPPAPVFVADVQVEPVEVDEQQEIEPVDLSELGPVGTARGETQGDAPGLENATGEGAGGTAAEGEFRVVAPNPRGMIWAPPDPPDDARGREITVYVFVNESGRVVGDSTRVVPSTGDGGYDREMIERANEWIFEPARREGRAVAEWTHFSFTL